MAHGDMGGKKPYQANTNTHLTMTHNQKDTPTKKLPQQAHSIRRQRGGKYIILDTDRQTTEESSNQAEKPESFQPMVLPNWQ